MPISIPRPVVAEGPHQRSLCGNRLAIDAELQGPGGLLEQPCARRLGLDLQDVEALQAVAAALLETIAQAQERDCRALCIACQRIR